jgi:hypothetical protein
MSNSFPIPAFIQLDDGDLVDIREATHDQLSRAANAMLTQSIHNARAAQAYYLLAAERCDIPTEGK